MQVERKTTANLTVLAEFCNQNCFGMELETSGGIVEYVLHRARIKKNSLGQADDKVYTAAFQGSKVILTVANETNYKKLSLRVLKVKVVDENGAVYNTVEFEY